jgi:hypothetical protein
MDTPRYLDQSGSHRNDVIDARINLGASSRHQIHPHNPSQHRKYKLVLSQLTPISSSPFICEFIKFTILMKCSLEKGSVAGRPESVAKTACILTTEDQDSMLLTEHTIQSRKSPFLKLKAICNNWGYQNLQIPVKIQETLTPCNPPPKQKPCLNPNYTLPPFLTHSFL